MKIKLCDLMQRWFLCLSLVVVMMLFLPVKSAWPCSRILYETGAGTYITGRSMDWSDPAAKTRLWVFPRGMERDGGTGKKAIQWTSKYGSVVTSFYDIATADGMNEVGLAGNVLYLAETDYGDASKTGKPTIKIGAWLQYYLDNFATVKEAVNAMVPPPFSVVAPTLPNGREATVHVSLSDATGDSAIFEYLGGKLIIHHGSGYKVMTNSPTYDQQLALNAYWDQIGGNSFLPGTISAADRFVRLSYNLKSSPKFKDPKLAVASVFSQMRAISVPLGMADPDHPNISMTLWRTVSDQGSKVYYFDSAIMPSVCWVDFSKVDFKKGSGARQIDIGTETELANEVSAEFTPAEPFKW
ncbi:linear amide C-N hydrolase [Maridesulfovibrio salexigens]|uniref:Choloylglycine hydrolase n=1 Tax=Maridesulfovibrio salexigens (strain ATCC 14822 / DSM 2638 / NCIMB 8403 / VKM B-1763) TaxID=526222 RepID=C6BYK3_MARSD|nr:linear amide C-N hydrolase [Maridesulfovibrio salexigens]ACS78794.1 Choloylglycine hydrolase [Maridesulfovibrio salexigens DSM 2638]